MGFLECDDGNTKDGDGCSAWCTIEYGYQCKQMARGPDICYDILPPKAFITVKGRNRIGIQFSEPVRLQGNNSKKFLSEYN